MNVEPLVRIVRGTPTAEQTAALVAVLVGRSMHADSSLPAGVAGTASTWVRSTRPDIAGQPGRGAWRSSGLPR